MSALSHTNRLRPLGITLLSLALCATSLHASAQESAVCAPTARVDSFRFLRQLSLDLRGRIPTEAEYDALRAAGDVSPEAIAEMMTGDDFFAQLRRYHRQLVWGSLDDVNNIVSTRHRIARVRIGANDIWYATQAGTLYRGDPGVSCVDVQHDRFDAAGHVLPLVDNYTGGTVRGAPAPRSADRCAVGSGCRIDGWVMVRPYWAPETQIRVCAFDAQALATGVRTGDASCGPDVTNDTGCGCGPNLRYCLTSGAGGTEELARDALIEEPLRIFEDVVRRRAPYFESLSTDATFMNGAAAHYYANTTAGVTIDAAMGEVPAMDFDSSEWVRVSRGEEHSGVLTTLLYLMRFASDRGRANRFYTAFMCEPFESPAEGLPPATDPCSSEPNLSERCGCATCHQRLEPTAAHWGRWRIGAQYGFLDERALPTFSMTCANCAEGRCSNFCNTYYMTRDTTAHPDEMPLLGQLQVSAWMSPEQAGAVERGPAGLLEREGAMGRLTSCAVRTVAEQFLHRELTPEEHLTWVPELAADFESSDHDFISLLEAVVRDPRYRAIR